ncbi:MAG: hypothetical protein NVV69_07025 [Methyloversatilis sp.]|uniref:hypothetical protein n=1 Tax=Methyloversatilis sp. TaxID=2569862 RepID=UPI0025D9BC9E|nr:hypothetical protein [Methyloversatilis sp.]MCR6665751.1 hypothetical protein [Methyloversatilis sp.]
MRLRGPLHAVFAALLLATFSIRTAMAEAPPVLDRIERTDFTVSGLSSGAAMAVQLGVAHSSRVRGIGIVSGPPYLCAQGFVTRATNDCLVLGRDRLRELFGPLFGLSLFSSGERDIDVHDLVSDTHKLARQRRIDPVDGLASQQIWEYRGQDDRVVGAKASAAQHAYFRAFGAVPKRGEPRSTPHTMPTSDPAQGSCDTRDEDYVSGCDFDAAGELLRHLRRRPDARPNAGNGRWYVLKQADFVPAGPGDAQTRRRALGLAEEARVYVPQRCSSESCQIHVALHGCKQGMSDSSYRAFTDGAGYVRWAGPLKLVLLFPRVGAIEPFERGLWDSVGNPMGCWDWWGYTTPGDLYGYATREAPQMRTIINMVDHLGRQH